MIEPTKMLMFALDSRFAQPGTKILRCPECGGKNLTLVIYPHPEPLAIDCEDCDWAQRYKWYQEPSP